MTTTRRDLLTGSVALVAAPLMPIGAMPSAAAARASDDAFRALLAAYNAAGAELNGEEPSGLTAKESNARFDSFADRLMIIEERIAAEPALTAFGVLVKWRAIQPTLKLYFPPGGLYDCIMKGLDHDLERLAAGGPA